MLPNGSFKYIDVVSPNIHAAPPQIAGLCGRQIKSLGIQMMIVVRVGQAETAKALPDMGNMSPKPPILKGSSFILKPGNLGRKLQNAKFICRENKGLGWYPSCFVLLRASCGIDCKENLPWLREEQKGGLHGICHTMDEPRGQQAERNNAENSEALIPLWIFKKTEKRGAQGNRVVCWVLGVESVWGGNVEMLGKG